jgi:hypothetical protein
MSDEKEGKEKEKVTIEVRELEKLEPTWGEGRSPGMPGM